MCFVLQYFFFETDKLISHYLWSFYQFEPHAPGVGFLVVVVGEDAEGADFGSVLHMGADAGAEVVVADTDEAQRLAGVVGQLPEVHLGRHLATLHELVADIQVTAYHLVHAALNLLHLLLRGTSIKQVVALALLLFYMGISRPRTAEHPHHRLVQYMLRRMHRRN